MGNEKDESKKREPLRIIPAGQTDKHHDDRRVAHGSQGTSYKPENNMRQAGRKRAPADDSRNARERSGYGDRAFMSPYPLPADVSANLNVEQSANFSLRFHRFIPRDIGKDGKIAVWKKLKDAGNKIMEQTSVHHFLDRRDALASTLAGMYGKERVLDWQGKTVARLSIGFGDAGPLDTGLTLHRLYSFPYLPATAIKGVCRAWALNDIAMELGVPRFSEEKIEELKKEKRKTPMMLLESLLLSHGKQDKDKEKKWDAFWSSMGKHEKDGEKVLEEGVSLDDMAKYDHFRRVFGSQDGRGEVHFYDAFPMKVPGTLFDLDIINVHYHAYFESKGKTPPADYLSPVPIFFLTVAPDVPFRFLMTCKYPTLRDKMESWLTGALAQFGIGAKTALGYGEITKTNLS